MSDTQALDTRPGHYYVSVVRDEGAFDCRLLAGPFTNDHAAALAAVDHARRLACELDPRGHWYRYGTCRLDPTVTPPAGILNDRLQTTPEKEPMQ